MSRGAGEQLRAQPAPHLAESPIRPDALLRLVRQRHGRRSRSLHLARPRSRARLGPGVAANRASAHRLPNHEPEQREGAYDSGQR
jgi:hypothetical protein